jgi:hypothetical protein
MQELEKMAGVTKFSRQAADLGAVFLYKEGLFVRAYNEGAYGFIHQLLACKPLRRFVKSAGRDRVVCGVPFTVLAALPAFQQATPVDALTWRWPLVTPVTPVDRAQYEAWREALSLVAVPLTPALSPLPGGEGDEAGARERRLIEQLMRFNVAASTPVAALNLVADLQRQWTEAA